jgi:hypothetical protein
LPLNSLGSGNLNLSLVDVIILVLVCGVFGGGGCLKNEDVTGNPAGGVCFKGFVCSGGSTHIGNPGCCSDEGPSAVVGFLG